MKQSSLLGKIITVLLLLYIAGSICKHIYIAGKKRQGALAIVTVSGTIHFDMGSPSWSDKDAGDVAAEFHRLSEDDDVKAILLRINSPGGTVGSVQEIYREMARCRAKGKKIIVSMGDVAASGGYYLAAGSDHIVANPGTITGSIGVILEFGNLEGLFQKVGVKLQVIKSGLHKDIGSPARALTPEEKVLLQASIDDAYAQFSDAVQEGRHLTPDQLKNIADGRIFTGRQALKVGLVDELGDEEDAIQAAIRLAKLPAKPFIVEDERRSFSSMVQRVTAQFSRQPLDSLQEAMSGNGMEYQWRP